MNKQEQQRTPIPNTSNLRNLAAASRAAPHGQGPAVAGPPTHRPPPTAPGLGVARPLPIWLKLLCNRVGGARREVRYVPRIELRAGKVGPFRIAFEAQDEPLGGLPIVSCDPAQQNSPQRQGVRTGGVYDGNDG